VWRVFGGAALVVGGIAAFIEAQSHRPRIVTEPGRARGAYVEYATGLSHTGYDLLRIGAWALVIVGGLLVVVGLIGYWGTQRDARPRA